MLIGYNQICINPTKPTIHVGIFNEKNPILNVRGDLYARCLRLKSDDHNLIILAFDSLGISKDIQKIFESKIKEVIKEDVTFIFSSTHTHYAPSLCNVNNLIRVDQTYMEYTVRKVALMIKNCHLVDKNIYVNYSWEHFDQVGKPRINNKSSDQVYGGVLSFYDDHARIGNIVFYNCHPTTPQGYANYFTSEFPGSAVERLIRKYPKEFFIYLQGADGDISTRLNRRSNNYDEITRLGNILALHFIKLMNRNANLKQRILTIDHIQEQFDVNVQLKPYKEILSDKLDQYTEKELVELSFGEKFVNVMKDKIIDTQTSVTFNCLDLAGYRLIFNPFELFSDYNRYINKDQTLLVCYSQGLIGYLTQPKNKHISYEYYIELQTEEDKQNVITKIKAYNQKSFFTKL